MNEIEQQAFAAAYAATYAATFAVVYAPELAAFKNSTDENACLSQNNAHEEAKDAAIEAAVSAVTNLRHWLGVE